MLAQPHRLRMVARLGGDAGLPQRRQERVAVGPQRVDAQPQRRRAGEPEAEPHALVPADSAPASAAASQRGSDKRRDEVFYRTASPGREAQAAPAGGSAPLSSGSASAAGRVGALVGEQARHSDRSTPLRKPLAARPAELRGQLDRLVQGGVGGDVRQQGELIRPEAQGVPQPRLDLVRRPRDERLQQGVEACRGGAGRRRPVASPAGGRRD